MSLTSDNINLTLKAALDVRYQRQEVLANNVANADTPGFRPEDLEFDGVLQREIGGPSPLGHTDGAHLDETGHLGMGARASFVGGADAGVAQQDLRERPDRLDTLDGNGVDMDREMARVADNAMQYKAAMEVMRRRVGILKLAITDMSR
ncbi:MAG: flagellar basal body rod protein FlgB [Myxococcales bacterium]|nr:flagellar basal body rod protein FlgB [Myxococcales bacterium]MCB9736835.1 flagellar basal body rod protein FlgB [Deltaproteobacteria bacterium]